MNFGGPTDEGASIAIIHRALDGGINFVDTADVYSGGESERIVGKALKQDGRREQVVLATKVYGEVGVGPNDRGVSRYHIVRACEDSLRRLQTERIDLYQLHRPSFEVPQEETLRAFDDLIRAGKVCYIGCSTHPAWKVMEALVVLERTLADADRPLFDALVHPGTAVADFHNSNEWMQARILDN
jgi:aryl-alcohol dehydrogenase-like predicted oxidoreductase